MHLTCDQEARSSALPVTVIKMLGLLRNATGSPWTFPGIYFWPLISSFKAEISLFGQEFKCVLPTWQYAMAFNSRCNRGAAGKVNRSVYNRYSSKGLWLLYVMNLITVRVKRLRQISGVSRLSSGVPKRLEISAKANWVTE